MRVNQSNAFKKLKSESDKIGWQFVMTELKLALSFLDIAGHSIDHKRRKELSLHVKRSYDLVLQALPHLSLSEKDQVQIDARLHQLRIRMECFEISDLASDRLWNAG
jgi:hypothetical protein